MSQFYWISLFCSKYFVHDCRMAKFHATLLLNGYRTRVFQIDNQRKQPLHYVQLVVVGVSVRLAIEISLGTKFHLKLTTNFQLNTNLFSPDTKFQLKLTILIFGPNLPEKVIYGRRRKKLNSAIELCIFELDQLPNFTLN